MEKYKVSVVVPTYNSGSFINSFFDSIRAQSIGFDNIQVIFVDDNSDDDYTLSLLNSLNEEFTNVNSVFLDKNHGFPGTGRNMGIDLSNSDYIIFSDHDDSYNPDAFEVMYNTAESENADVVITNYYKVYPNKKVKVETVFNGQNIIVNSVYDDSRLFNLNPAIWCKLFRKDFLVENNIRFLEGMLGEDLYVYIVSIFKSNTLVYLDDFFSYNYNIRNVEGDKSTIHIRNKKYLGKMIEGYWKVNQFLLDNDLDQYYCDIFNMHFVYWITSLILSDISDEEKLDLIKSINDLLKKDVSVIPGFGERIYSDLTQPILDDDYEEVLKIIKSIKRRRGVINKVKGVFSKFRR